MDGRSELPETSVKLRSEAEGRLAEMPSEGGIWYSAVECQRLVHELHVYEIEMDLVREELEANQIGLKQWRDEARLVQAEFREITKKLALMADSPEKVRLGIQCVEATLHFIEDRFRRMVQGDAATLPGRDSERP